MFLSLVMFCVLAHQVSGPFAEDVRYSAPLVGLSCASMVAYCAEALASGNVPTQGDGLVLDDLDLPLGAPLTDEGFVALIPEVELRLMEAQGVDLAKEQRDAVLAARLLEGLVQLLGHRGVADLFRDELLSAFEEVRLGAVGKLDEATRPLRQALEQRRVVALVGLHVPQEVRRARLGVDEVAVVFELGLAVDCIHEVGERNAKLHGRPFLGGFWLGSSVADAGHLREPLRVPGAFPAAASCAWGPTAPQHGPV